MLPGFCARNCQTDILTACHWPWLLLMVLESLVGSGWSEVNLPAAGVLGLAAALLERTQRDQWVLYKSYAQAEELHFRLFMCSPLAEFIVSSTGEVLCCNTAATSLIPKLEKRPPIHYLQDLFSEEFAQRFKELLNAAMRGEEEEEELFLKTLPSRLDASELNDLAVKVQLQHCVWKNGNCVRVTCSDISPFMTRRLFLLQLYKGAYSALYTFLHALKRLFLCGEAVQAEDMFKHNKQASILRHALVLQSHFLGRMDVTRELFHVRNDVTAIAESARFKAELLNVSLAVSKDSLPLEATGDRQKHSQLLTILLDFALEQADPASEVALICALRTDHSLAMYRVTFHSHRLTQSTLTRLFTRRKERKSLQQIVDITAEFGVGLAIFDTLLTVMQGSVKDAYIGQEQKVVLAYE